jgi:hypothetical protein
MQCSWPSASPPAPELTQAPEGPIGGGEAHQAEAAIPAETQEEEEDTQEVEEEAREPHSQEASSLEEETTLEWQEPCHSSSRETAPKWNYS